MSAVGRVGLVVREDSFIAQNIEFEYKPTEISVVVSQWVSQDKLVDSELSDVTTESVLVKAVWNPFTEHLTDTFHRQLGAVLVEFSVSELVSGREVELREYTSQHTEKANCLVDTLLCSAKDYLVSKNYRTIEAPPFTAVFKGKTVKPQYGVFKTETGFIQDLSTLSRIQDMSFYEDREQLVVYGYIQLKEFKHGYEKYHAKYQRAKVHGGIKTTIYRNRVLIKVSIRKRKHENVTTLDRIEMNVFKDVSTDTSHLGSLAWLTQQVEAWVIGNMRSQGIPGLERCIREAFEHAIANTDCVALVIS